MDETLKQLVKDINETYEQTNMDKNNPVRAVGVGVAVAVAVAN
jgi:hypothetical protein